MQMVSEMVNKNNYAFFYSCLLCFCCRTRNHSINGPGGLNRTSAIVGGLLRLSSGSTCIPERLISDTDSFNRRKLSRLHRCIAISSISLEFHKRLRSRESFSSQKAATQLGLISNFAVRIWGGVCQKWFKVRALSRLSQSPQGIQS